MKIISEEQMANIEESGENTCCSDIASLLHMRCSDYVECGACRLEQIRRIYKLQSIDSRDDSKYIIDDLDLCPSSYLTQVCKLPVELVQKMPERHQEQYKCIHMMLRVQRILDPFNSDEWIHTLNTALATTADKYSD